MKSFRRIFLGEETLLAVLVRIMVFCFCFCVVLKSFYGFRITVGESMSPTLQNKEIFISKNFNHSKDSVNRFDVIIVTDPTDISSLLVKRIVALPGETVEIKEGVIYLNEKKLEDSFGDGSKVYVYLVDESDEHLIEWGTGKKVIRYIDEKKMTIPKNRLWVIGDNRSESWYGVVEIKEIKGRILWGY